MAIDFRSDNTLGCSPEVLEALERAAGGSASPYGNDEITGRLRRRVQELFEREADIFPVMTGTAGNSLALAAMSPEWGAIFCHEDAHIHRDEFGAPEFFTRGAKLIPLAGRDGKISAAELDRMIADVGDSGRMAVPSCISLTQATEAGTVYQVDELQAIAEVARRRGTGVHMDGARFANAVVHTGRSPADLTWRAGVDVLIFGATKNGGMSAELMVVFRRELSESIARRLHRSGHRESKMRFLSAQLDACLADDLWLRNASAANEAASKLERELRRIAGVEILRPVQANILFVRFPSAILARLHQEGHQFYEWPLFGEGAVRLVTGFSTTEADADQFVRSVRA